MGYYTPEHRVYPIECGIVEFDSRAKTENGLWRAACKAAGEWIRDIYPHATGYRVWNVR